MCGYEVFVYIIYIILPEKAEILENPFDCSKPKLKSAFFPPLAIWKEDYSLTIPGKLTRTKSADRFLYLVA